MESGEREQFIKELQNIMGLIGSTGSVTATGIGAQGYGGGAVNVNIIPNPLLNGTNRMIKMREDDGWTHTFQVPEEDYYRFLFMNGLTDQAIDAACSFAMRLVNRRIDQLVKRYSNL